MISFARVLTLGCALLLFFSFSNCGSTTTASSETSFQSDPPFTLTQASFQEWTAGTQQGGSGINVSLVFEPLNQNITPQQFYFRNQIGEIRTKGNNRYQFFVNYKNRRKPDVIMDGDAIQEAQNTPPVKFPFDLEENEAVMSYLDHDVVLFYRIPTLDRKEPLFYPSSAPVDEN